VPLPIVGQAFSHYRIVAELGGGGMGVVYEAEDIRLGRHVAVKFLPEETTGSREALDRFAREARAASALNHPHICTVHDLGEEAGRPFIVMELMKGQTLKARIEGRALPIDRVLTLGAQIADALDAAHHHGIVHRDIKPANIFVTEHGEAKLLDFGLAKLAAGATPGGAGAADDRTVSRVDEVTSPGTTMGTVSYMSPEQARGEAVGAGSDLFSLGVVLYEMATGVLPFRGQSATEIIDAILNREPVPPVRLNPDAPAELERVIAKALEKDPALRYQSAADMKADLKRLQRDTGAVHVSGPVPVPRRSRRRLAIHATVAAAVVLVAAGLWFMRSPPSPAMSGGAIRIAVLPFENLGPAADAYFTDGMTDEVRSKLASLPRFAVIARSSAMAYKGISKTPQVIAKELGAGYLLTGTVRWQKGESGASRIRVVPELVEISPGGTPITRWQDSFDAVVEDVFRVQGEIAARVAGALKVSLGATEQQRLATQPTANLAAYEAYLKGEAVLNSGDFSVSGLQRAMAQYQQAVGLDSSFALAWARLSLARATLYYSVPSAALAEAARVAAERSLQLGPGLSAGRLAMSSYLSLVAKDNARALEQVNQGLATDPGNAELLVAAAAAERNLGRWEQAIARLEQARSIDPRSTAVLNRLAAALTWTRRYTPALEAFEAGLNLAPANPSLIENKAMVLLARGDLAGARAWLARQPPEQEAANLAQFAVYWDLMWIFDEAQRAAFLRLPIEATGGDPAFHAMAVAQTHALGGSAAELRRAAEEAERGFRRYLADTPNDEQMLVLHGLSLAYLGRRDEAVGEGERAVAVMPISRDAYSGPYIQHQLVRIYLILGEREKALDRLEPLLQIPYYLSPRWLAIDPNFAPLKGHPRFENLLKR